MKDFRSRGTIFSVTARFLHSSLFSFLFNRLSSAAFSCARSLAAGSTGGPIVKLWFCAIAASGHATAAPPRIVMNSRRLISAPSSGDGILSAQTSTLKGAETRIKTIAAVHSQCRSWVISRQTIDRQIPPLSALVQKRTNAGAAGLSALCGHSPLRLPFPR
jgi:hypothetical protein